VIPSIESERLLAAHHHDIFARVLEQLVSIELDRRGVSEDIAPEHVAIARKYADLSYPLRELDE
jgi:hypothetical protein